MATLTAPYVPAMRMGQGFNSFTQELRVYNAVQAARRPEVSGEYQAHPSYSVDYTLVEARAEHVNQTVSYCATVVTHISQVTELLNVSAPRQIKGNATGGGGLVINFEKFHKSDVNFFIHVSVINRHLVAPGLTEFSLNETTSPSDFTRVYGDTFISGFTEGGEFSALISIKLEDDRSIDEVRKQLRALFDIKGGPVDGQAQADAKRIAGETTVSVSWTGGGDMNDADKDDWTLAKLKSAALKFPQCVNAYPARTRAILTKYTCLESAQTAAIKAGSPLDYENTTLYSSVLLDAYMDYKAMLQNISHAIQEVDRGQCVLESNVDTSQFAGSAREAKAHYEEEMDKYTKQPVPDDTIPAAADEDSMSSLSSFSVVVGATRKREPPARPNELVPYSADIVGLDTARRDCRFEMAKIVREVDAVAADPGVATDVDRRWAYLSPAVFRLLLPVVRNLGKEQAVREAAERAAQTTRTAVAQAETIERLDDDLTKTKEKLSMAEGVLHKLKPYSFLPSIGVDAPLKFKSASTDKVFDYHPPSGSNCRQIDSQQNNGNQKFMIVDANGLGHHIIHCDSGRYLAANAGGSSKGGAIPLILCEHFGSVFVFEQADNGTFRIRLADQPRYTVVVEGGKRDNDVQLFLEVQSTRTADKWRAEAFQ